MNLETKTDFEQEVYKNKENLRENPHDMRNFYAALLNTAEQCGLKVVSDDTCCKVLAWLYVHGGGYEVGYNVKLLADIKYAQKRLNAYGSEIPDSELCETLRERVKELQATRPDWLYELKERYDLPDYAIGKCDWGSEK